MFAKPQGYKWPVEFSHNTTAIHSWSLYLVRCVSTDLVLRHVVAADLSVADTKCEDTKWYKIDTRCEAHHKVAALISDDSGVHFRTGNSLSCSRNQLEMTFSHSVLLCWKQPSEEGYIRVIKGWTAAMLREDAVFICSVATKGPNVRQENIPQCERGRVDPFFHVVHANMFLWTLDLMTNLKN